MPLLRFLLVFLVTFTILRAQGTTAHVWEKQELIFTAQNTYANAYTDATVWVDLKGPGFEKRVFGFWDGGSTFKVRLMATAPGAWTWHAGSAPFDPGISGQTGKFTATEWTEEEKQANPLRRGMIRATANGHALEHPDGTPFFAVGDTWFALSANRMKWIDDERERPIGPDAGFKDYVRLRKSQGYNFVCIIASFPNWNTDGKPFRMTMDDDSKTPLRFAWLEFGTGSAKNMDNEGGKPFHFPGRVPGHEDIFPDVNRINPEYFKYLDRKIDYLNAQGFVPFIEAARRDVSRAWAKYYDWPESYARYVQYLWARYQANVTVAAPVHLDILQQTVSPDAYDAAVQLIKSRYGLAPFGTLISTNSNPSSLTNWGERDWLTLHQTGNMREHDNYWFLTEIYHLPKPIPAFNGEPYYAGYKDVRGLGGKGYRFGAPGGTELDDLFCRSGMYGSVLSGGFAGHVYGAEGIWGSDIEPTAPTKMWDAFKWNSGAQMGHLKTFILSEGKRYQELVPLADLVSPNKSAEFKAYQGWAYCARTNDKNLFMAYFEKDAPQAIIRGAHPHSRYRAQWYNPRDGTWQDVGTGYLTSTEIGRIHLPVFPTGTLRYSIPEHWVPQRLREMVEPFRAGDDWGLKLVYVDRAPVQEYK